MNRKRKRCSNVGCFWRGASAKLDGTANRRYRILPKPGQRDPIKMQYWREHITAWRDSGLSKSQYCQRHGLKLNNFCSWEAKVGESDKAVSSIRTSRRSKPKHGKNRTARCQSASPEADCSASDEHASFVQAKIRSAHDATRPPASLECIEVSCSSGVLIKLPVTTNTDTLLAVLVALAG